MELFYSPKHAIIYKFKGKLKFFYHGQQETLVLSIHDLCNGCQSDLSFLLRFQPVLLVCDP